MPFIFWRFCIARDFPRSIWRVFTIKILYKTLVLSILKTYQKFDAAQNVLTFFIRVTVKERVSYDSFLGSYVQKDVPPSPSSNLYILHCDCVHIYNFKAFNGVFLIVAQTIYFCCVTCALLL